MKKRLIYFSILTLLLATSCTCHRKANQPKKEKEINKSEVKVTILRFEQEWFAINPANLPNELKKLRAKYPMQYDAYYNYVMEFPKYGNSEKQLEIIHDFLTKKDMQGLYDTVMVKYPGLGFLEDELQTAFANYISYFPEKPVPQVMTCITEFAGFPAFTVGDSLLGICIDDHLGPKYKFYTATGFFYDYQLYALDKKFMAVHAVKVLATNNILPPDARSSLLDKILVYGKMLYFMQSLLPDRPPQDMMEYTDAQWKWCKDNQKQIWAYFLENKLLYDTRPEQMKYLEEGPYTYGMPKESPGRVGAWLGWQIVQAYMKQNPNTTLKQLLAINDSQKILEGSNYRPEK